MTQIQDVLKQLDIFIKKYLDTTYVTSTENDCEGPASEVTITFENCEIIYVLATVTTKNQNFIDKKLLKKMKNYY